MNLTDFSTNTTFIFSPRVPEDVINSTTDFSIDAPEVPPPLQMPVSMNFTEEPPESPPVPTQMPVSLNITEEQVLEPVPVYQPVYKIPQGGLVALHNIYHIVAL
jgi:hypothetical protein